MLKGVLVLAFWGVRALPFRGSEFGDVKFRTSGFPLECRD